MLPNLSKFPPIFHHLNQDIWDHTAKYRYHQRYCDSLSRFFKNRDIFPHSTSQTYHTQSCLEKIKEAILTDMYEDQFDLTPIIEGHLNNKAFKDYRWNKVRTPALYLRFRCKNCQNKGKQRRWTSYFGTALLKFKLVPINVYNEKVDEEMRINTDGLRYSTPFVVFISLKLFKMQCKQCYSSGQAFIFQPFLEEIIDRLCLRISNQLNGTKTKLKRPKSRKRKSKANNPHIKELCEACQKGVCSYQDSDHSDPSNSQIESQSSSSSDSSQRSNEGEDMMRERRRQ